MKRSPMWVCAFFYVCESLQYCWGVGPLSALLVLNAEQAASGQGKWLQGLLSDCSTGCTRGMALHSNTDSHSPLQCIPTGGANISTTHGPYIKKKKIKNSILMLMLISQNLIPGLIWAFSSCLIAITFTSFQRKDIGLPPDNKTHHLHTHTHTFSPPCLFTRIIILACFSSVFVFRCISSPF